MFESFIMGGPAISTLSATVPVLDEVELYLSTGPETLKYMDHGQEKSFMPLEWWVNHRGTYPRLSRMALDYLSVPGEFLTTFIFFYLSELASNFCRR